MGREARVVLLRIMLCQLCGGILARSLPYHSVSGPQTAEEEIGGNAMNAYMVTDNTMGTMDHHSMPMGTMEMTMDMGTMEMTMDMGTMEMTMDMGTMDMGTMDMGDMEMDMGMKMYFHMSEKATILFEGWQTTNWQQMLGSCIGLGIIACLYEGYKIGREVLSMEKQSARRGSHRNAYTIGNAGFEAEGIANTNNNNSLHDDQGHRMCSGWHWLQTFLHVLQIFVSYCLMLVVMTYNGWLVIAVCIGSGFGYLFFGWMKSGRISDNDHCN